MNRSKVTQILETLNISPDEIADERLAEAFRILFQLIEELSEENEKLKAENQNVEYKKEIYYSPSQHKTYMGKLPHGIEGEFGPGVKSLVCALKHVANVSEPKIHEFFDNFGIYISPAKISRIITKDNELFHREKADIFLAGLLYTDYQQIDDTSSRVHGENHYTQIVCNCEAFLIKLFLKVFTTLRTSRLLTIGKLRDEAQMQQLLEGIFPDPGKGKIRRTRIMEAAAIAAYHQQTDFPPKRGILLWMSGLQRVRIRSRNFLYTTTMRNWVRERRFASVT